MGSLSSLSKKASQLVGGACRSSTLGDWSAGTCLPHALEHLEGRAWWAAKRGERAKGQVSESVTILGGPGNPKWEEKESGITVLKH